MDLGIQKGEKEKRPLNSCKFKLRVFEGTQVVFQRIFMFLEYRNIVLLRGACG
jgi:hypothetical protein